MKVIYEKPIYDRIAEAYVEALTNNKKIETVVLTKEEYNELQNWSRWSGLNYDISKEGKVVSSIYGINIEVEYE